MQTRQAPNAAGRSARENLIVSGVTASRTSIAKISAPSRKTDQTHQTHPTYQTHQTHQTYPTYQTYQTDQTYPPSLARVNVSLTRASAVATSTSASCGVNPGARAPIR